MIIAKQIQEATERAKTLKGETEIRIRGLQAELKRLESFHRLVFRLSSSWRDDDPGKYGVHVFFVRSYELEPRKDGLLPHAKNIDKFWVAELADEPEEIKLGRRRRYVYQGDSERIPVPLGSLDEARHEKCPCCDREGIVIGTYCQTYDSPEGDTWEKTLHVLCVQCLTATPIAKRCMDGRF